MTDATQTQVTGPVDDAQIDADVDLLIQAAQAWQVAGGSPKSDKYRADTKSLARSITARLAPRADALIEREQVDAAIAKHLCDEINPHRWDNNNPGVRAIYYAKADRIMALLPRAPMPDVVTVPVNPIWLLCSISYLNDLSERGIGTDAKDIVMIRQIIAEFRAALEANTDAK